MPIEAAGFISELDPLNPDGEDDYATADDHSRLIKAVLKAQFPNFTAEAVNALVADLNVLVGAAAAGVTPTKLGFLSDVTAAIQAQINANAAAAAANAADIVTLNSFFEGGAFTMSLTGMSTAVQGTVNYLRVVNMVVLYLTASIFGTSNSNSMSFSGIPAAIRPSVQQRAMGMVRNDGGFVPGMLNINTDGTGTCFIAIPQLLTNQFTASGSKGLQQGSSFVYFI